MGKKTGLLQSEQHEFLPKRSVGFVEATVDEEQKSQTAEELKQKENLEALQEYFGLSAEQADESIRNDAERRDQAIQDLLSDWKGREWRDKFKGLFSKQFQKMGTVDKKALDLKVTTEAEKKVEGLIYDINGEEEESYHLQLQDHAHLSLAILNAKSDVLTDFQGAIAQQLEQEKTQLSRVQEMLKALHEAKSWPYRVLSKEQESPALDEINKRIEQFTEMQEAAKVLADETTEKKKEHQQENKELAEKENLLSMMVLERAPHLAAEFEEAMANSALDQNLDYFQDFLDDHEEELKLSDAEKDDMLRFASVFFADSENGYGYFLNKQYERGTLNRHDDKIENRIKRVTELPGDKLLKMIFDGAAANFQVIGMKSEKRRVFIQSEEAKGIINYSNPSKPFMTIQFPGEAPQSYELSIPDQHDRKVSLTAVEFHAEELDLSPPSEA